MMPRLPRALDRAQTRPIATPFSRSPSGAVRGTAAGISRLGGTIAQVVHTAQSDEINRANDAQVVNALVEMQGGFTQISAGPDGFEQVLAQDAIDQDILQKYGDSADKLQADVSDRLLKTDDLRRLSAGRIASMRARFDLGLNRHFSVQSRQADVNNTTQLVADGRREFVSNLTAGGPSAVALAVTSMDASIDLIEGLCDRRGLNDSCDSQVMEFTSGAINEALLSVASTGAASTALEYFEELGGMEHRGRPLLTNKDRVSLRDALEPEADRQWGLRQANEDYAQLTENGNEPELSLKDLQTISERISIIDNPQRLNAYRTTMANLRADSDRLVIRRQRENYTWIRDRIEAGEMTFSNAPLERRLDVNDQQSRALAATSARIFGKRDVKSQWSIVGSKLKAMSPQEFVDFDLTEWDHLLSEADKKGLFKEQRQMKLDLAGGSKVNIVGARALIDDVLKGSDLSTSEIEMHKRKIIERIIDEQAAGNTEQLAIIRDEISPVVESTMWWESTITKAQARELKDPRDIVRIGKEDDPFVTVPRVVQDAIVDTLGSRVGDGFEEIDATTRDGKKRVQHFYALWALDRLKSSDGDLRGAIQGAQALAKQTVQDDQIASTRRDMQTIVNQHRDTPIVVPDRVILRQDEADDGELIPVFIEEQVVDNAIASLGERFPNAALTQEAIRREAILLNAVQLVRDLGIGVLPESELSRLQDQYGLDAIDIQSLQIEPGVLWFFAMTGERMRLDEEEARRLLDIRQPDILDSAVDRALGIER